jgi:hypothetical protein
MGATGSKTPEPVPREASEGGNNNLFVRTDVTDESGEPSRRE